MTRFRIFYGDAQEVERGLNELALSLPLGTRFRTQIAAKPSNLYVLVSYDAPYLGEPRVPGHIFREIETWTDACGCAWANTSTRTTTCAEHGK